MQTPAADIVNRPKSAQKAFFEKVRKLSTVQHDMGNPFLEQSAYRHVIDTKDIANPVVAESIGTHHKRGTDQFQSFPK